MPDYIGAVWSAASRSKARRADGRDARWTHEGEASDLFQLAAGPGRGDAEPAFYDKRHLVPFGEYFPVPAWVRNWLRLMNLPYSDFTPGATRPAAARAGRQLKVAASICYEDAYPAQPAARDTRRPTLLVTVTNDAWFGRSGARYQHLQIARMRALEAGASCCGRPMTACRR